MDWHAVPGPQDFYQPDVVGPSLERLAAAKGTATAASAASRLFSGGLIHDSTGTLLPAAAVAAPLLLDIVQHGHPAARSAAAALLGDSMDFYPLSGHTRASAGFASAVPICCAIAHHVHTRYAGDAGSKWLRALAKDAREHWLFHCTEVADDGDDTIVIGELYGVPLEGRQAAECHSTAGYAVLDSVALEYPMARGDTQACFRLFGVRARRIPEAAVLLSAEHGRRVD